ncbi:MAG: tetratricopeptide repeat protein, partial [Methylocella sp.]
VEAHREATKELTRERVPLQWAVTQHNLAVVHRALFEKDRVPRHLDNAIAAIDGALEEFRTANKTR